MKHKPARLDLEIRFSRALRTLPPKQKQSLNNWLRHRLKTKTNGHRPPRTFYIINPTGGLDPL